MRISIIGASAGVGLAAVVRALELGHTVTSLSRSIDSLPNDPALTVIKGSALDPAAVINTITAADAVLVTLGTGTSTKATTLYTDAAAVLIAAAAKVTLTAPVIAITGFGAGDSSHYQNVLMRTVMKTVLGKVYANKTQMEQMLAASTLTWEIMRPGRLTETPQTGTYRTITEYRQGMKIGSISRADVADYLVTETGKREHLRRYPALSY